MSVGIDFTAFSRRLNREIEIYNEREDGERARRLITHGETAAKRNFHSPEHHRNTHTHTDTSYATNFEGTFDRTRGACQLSGSKARLDVPSGAATIAPIVFIHSRRESAPAHKYRPRM